MYMYEKIPEIIEAFRYNVDREPGWFKVQVDLLKVKKEDKRCLIYTDVLGYFLEARIGDYIIRGKELKVMKPYQFRLTYQPYEKIEYVEK